ncbi:hypothetical protein ANN_11275 [Periplaneta americana]|uniref:Uncharacterized protein n=1 Tax=Periplaneta americana TaxID=6978 RepID=A0ABQ8T6U8_PERAM|nr:hypothetical protein ANN_11275 [Periplaneta americana]
MFAVTYVCEKLFSTMKIVNIKFRSGLTDKYLRDQLRLADDNNARSESAVRISYKICHEIAKELKTLNESEFIKRCLIILADELCPHQSTQIKRIPNLTGPVDNNDATLQRNRNKTAGRIDGCHGDCNVSLGKSRDGFELNELHQLLLYADEVNMLRENPQAIRENTEILLEASYLESERDEGDVLAREFQSRRTVAEEEDEYEDVRWESMDNIEECLGHGFRISGPLHGYEWIKSIVSGDIHSGYLVRISFFIHSVYVRPAQTALIERGRSFGAGESSNTSPQRYVKDTAKITKYYQIGVVKRHDVLRETFSQESWHTLHDGNAALARRLYQERYPQRQCPDRKTFVRLHYRLLVIFIHTSNSAVIFIEIFNTIVILIGTFNSAIISSSPCNFVVIFEIFNSTFIFIDPFNAVVNLFDIFNSDVIFIDTFISVVIFTDTFNSIVIFFHIFHSSVIFIDTFNSVVIFNTFNSAIIFFDTVNSVVTFFDTFNSAVISIDTFNIVIFTAMFNSAVIFIVMFNSSAIL